MIRASIGCWRAVCRWSEQDLDDADIDVVFEQMGGEAVPQSMRRHALGDAGLSRRVAHDAGQLTGGHRVDRVHPGKQPGLGPRRPPPITQPFQQLRREHDIAVALALALFDPQGHALAVDVGHFQRHHLGDAQSGAIRRRRTRPCTSARERLRGDGPPLPRSARPAPCAAHARW